MKKIAEKSKATTKLWEAVKDDDIKLIKQAIKENADVNDKDKKTNDFSPLHSSLSAEATKILIKAGANPDAKTKTGTTPLFLAKSKKMTEALIKGGADVRIKNEYKETPLFYARTQEQANYLIDAGVDFHAKNSKKKNACEYQKSFGSKFVAKLISDYIKGKKKRGLLCDDKEDNLLTKILKEKARNRA